MKKFTALLIVIVLLVFVSQTGYAQKVFLRHQFAPGETAKAQTAVKLQGDSLFGEGKGATNCSFNFTKQYLVNQVKEDGTGDINLAISQIRAQGTFENKAFNEDYSGAKLKKLMANSDKVRVSISPDGVVKGNDALPLAQMGISMPMEPSSFGGFEFPTFPVESVQPGSAWSENGTILRGKDLNPANQDEGVYFFQRITSAGSYGRAAVLRYKKTTDFSGLSLTNTGGNGALSALPGGNGALSALPGGSGALASLAGNTGIGDMAIQLEGEILFAIDKGLVLKSTQTGFVSMQKSNASGNAKNRFQVQQRGLKLYTQTSFDWSNIQHNAPANQPAINPNPMAKLPRRQPQVLQPPVSKPQVTSPDISTPQEFPPPQIEKIPEENKTKKDN